MTDYAVLAARINDALALTTPPVAVTFTDAAPAGATGPAQPVPAGCSFWQTGTTQTVTTDAGDHRFCSIGIHTHQLSGAPASQAEELRTALGAMQGLDYVRPEEVAALPIMSGAHRHVVYGPLAEATLAPSVVLVFAHAAQGLVVTEALSRVDGAAPPAMGRPACALVPQIINSGRSASSLGCCGARAYLDIFGDDVTLWGLAGDRLEAYVDALETLAKANTVLTQFHDGRRKAIEAGGTPTVADSLATLG